MSGKDEEQALWGRVAQRRFASYRKRSPFRLAAAAAIFVLSASGSATAFARMMVPDRTFVIDTTASAGDMLWTFAVCAVTCFLAVMGIPDKSARRQVLRWSLIFIGACVAGFGLPGLMPHCQEYLNSWGSLVGDCRSSNAIGRTIIGLCFALPLLFAADVKLRVAQRLEGDPSAGSHRAAAAIFFALGLGILSLPALATLTGP